MQLKQRRPTEPSGGSDLIKQTGFRCHIKGRQRRGFEMHKSTCICVCLLITETSAQTEEFVCIFCHLDSC